jgi:2-dehydropantoate 2-reductase
MEIESIVRAPVAFARSAGVDTPTLDAIESICVALAHAKGLYTP